MTPLYAYDFDKTLIPYDSFRRYLMHLLRLRPVRVGGLLLLRKLRLISGTSLKARITRMVNRSEALQRDAKHFANRVIYDVQLPVATPKDAKVLLISASPSIYMQYIASSLACSLLCSDFVEGNKYVEMYGKKKLETLHMHFPVSEYDYVFAASDSESDLCWMKEFKQYDIVKRQ